VSRIRVQAAAAHRIYEIYHHSLETWGEAQAERYVRGLFARFDAIAARDFPWRAVPAAFGVEGYVCRYEQHMIYWKVLATDDIGIVTVLHVRMHQIERLRDDYAP